MSKPTGFNDAFGTPIHEGDILAGRTDRAFDAASGEYGLSERSNVIWDSLNDRYKWNGHSLSSVYNNTRVIGNINLDPEVLDTNLDGSGNGWRPDNEQK